MVLQVRDLHLAKDQWLFQHDRVEGKLLFLFHEQHQRLFSILLLAQRYKDFPPLENLNLFVTMS
jgi:hypothetical protein